MGFQKGHKKTGGIQKGQVHRKTRVELACEAAGVDPFKVMALIAADDSHPDRMIAAKELAKYLEPQKKATEITGKDGEDITMRVIVEDYSK